MNVIINWGVDKEASALGIELVVFYHDGYAMNSVGFLIALSNKFRLGAKRMGNPFVGDFILAGQLAFLCLTLQVMGEI